MISLTGCHDWMPYFHGITMVNISGCAGIIVSFLQENTLHIAIVMAPHVYTQWHQPCPQDSASFIYKNYNIYLYTVIVTWSCD